MAGWMDTTDIALFICMAVAVSVSVSVSCRFFVFATEVNYFNLFYKTTNLDR